MLLKKTTAMFVTFVFLCMLPGCGMNLDKPPFTYQFRQDRENIARIEVCKYAHEYDTDGGMIEPIAEIADTDITSFLDDIQALDCKEFVMFDQILSYGDIVIAITYLNGEIEILGIHNIGWISVDHDMTTTRYRFGIEDICKVISKYVDPTILDDASEYF